MNNIEEITITFENCDQITLNSKDIGIVFFNDIKTEITRIARNSIQEINTATEVAIELYASKINSLYSPFNEFDEMPIASRIIAGSDIVSFLCKYQNGLTKTIYAPWGSCTQINEYQKQAIGNNGNLYVVISKDKIISDFFNDEVMMSTDTFN